MDRRKFMKILGAVLGLLAIPLKSTGLFSRFYERKIIKPRGFKDQKAYPVKGESHWTIFCEGPPGQRFNDAPIFSTYYDLSSHYEYFKFADSNNVIKDRTGSDWICVFWEKQDKMPKGKRDYIATALRKSNG